MAVKTKPINTAQLPIRRGELKDLAAIQELNRQMCVKEHREYDATINPNYPVLPMGKAYFKGRILGKDSCAFVVIDKEKPVGYLVGSIVASEDYRTVGKMAELENMFVMDDYRSMGIGKRLVDAFTEWCEFRGVELIKAVASAQNSRAIGFYEREGMKQTAVTLEKRLKLD